MLYLETFWEGGGGGRGVSNHVTRFPTSKQMHEPNKEPSERNGKHFLRYFLAFLKRYKSDFREASQNDFRGVKGMINLSMTAVI